MKFKNFTLSNLTLGVLFTALVVVAYSFTFSTAFAATVPTVNVSINNENNSNVTSVNVGTVVRLNTTVASSSGPVAQGTVDFSSFANTTCAGTATSQNGVALVNGSANSSTTTVPANGLSYKVFYNSQTEVYASTTSSCVSVTAVTPATTTPPVTVSGNGSISGTSYNDLNKNKVKDGGESGISGFTVNLYGGTFWWNWGKMSVVKTTTTDSNGNYSFTGLADGLYRVEEKKLNGWAQISGDFKWVLILNGKNLTGLDFANIAKANASTTATTTPVRKDNDHKNRGQEKKIEKMQEKEMKKEAQRERKITKLLGKIEKIKDR